MICPTITGMISEAIAATSRNKAVSVSRIG
jgi:hypothetical protein